MASDTSIGHARQNAGDLFPFGRAIHYSRGTCVLWFGCVYIYIYIYAYILILIATLTMSLNAINLDPERVWKHPWRWFSQEMLDCCTPLETIKEIGLSIDQFVCLARFVLFLLEASFYKRVFSRCHGALTRATHGTPSFTLDRFRGLVQASSRSSSQVLVVNYARPTLGQTGNGHFSPIGMHTSELFCSRT